MNILTLISGGDIGGAKTHVLTLLRELSRFAASRLFTFLLQELLLFITVNLMHLDSVIMKMATSVLVIILNYFLSKLFIFKKEPSHEDQTQLQ